MRLRVDFCGEQYQVDEGTELTIGRDADLALDNNPYLHRRFLRITHQGGMWLLTNVGSQLAATIADDRGTMQAWLAPGAQVPLVFERCSVWFTAGPTTYEFEIAIEDSPFMRSTQNLRPTGARLTEGRRSRLTSGFSSWPWPSRSSARRGVGQPLFPHRPRLRPD